MPYSCPKALPRFSDALQKNLDRLYTNQSIIVWTGKTKFLLPALYKGRNYPSLTKRGEGRFSGYVFSIMDSLVNSVIRELTIELSHYFKEIRNL